MRRCPNCGFYNFTIAETCGRCETPFTETMPKPSKNMAASEETLEKNKSKNLSIIDKKLLILATELKSLPPLVPEEEGDIQDELPPMGGEKILAEEPLDLAAYNEAISSPALEEAAAAEMPANCASVTLEEQTIKTQLPSFFRRFTATCIDSFLALIVFAAAVLFLLSPEALFGTAASSFYGIDKIADLLSYSASSFFSALLVTCAVAVLYNWIAVTAFHKTIGHKLMGLKVVRSDTTAAPGIFRSFFRAIALVIGTLCAGIGIYWRVMDSLRRDFGDLAAKTMVVKNN